MESPERGLGIRVVAFTANVPIHAVGVRPIGFNGYRAEAFLDDQTLGDLRALVIEVVGAVRSLAEEDESRIANEVEQWAVVSFAAIEMVRARTKISDCHAL